MRKRMYLRTPPVVAPTLQPSPLPDILLDPALSPLEKWVWLIVHESACPSQDDMAALLNVSTRTVQSALAALESLGRLAAVERGAGRRNRYVTLPRAADASRQELARRIVGARKNEPTANELFYRSEKYAEYLREMCAKRRWIEGDGECGGSTTPNSGTA
jgi:hypothetical protein